MYLPVPDRTARGPSNGPYDSNVRQPTRHREPKAHRRYYRGSGCSGSQRPAGLRASVGGARRLAVACSASKNLSNQRSVQLRTPGLCQKDTRERREGTLETRFSVQGIRQRTPVFLTSPSEVPTLTPFSSSACGRPPAAPREGRADRTVVGAPRMCGSSSRPFTHRSACRAPGMIRGSAHRRTRVCQRERSRDC